MSNQASTGRGQLSCRSRKVWHSKGQVLHCPDRTRAPSDKLLIAISSDQYFGRGTYDPVAGSEAQQRLQQFSGATAISSNAYFGRPEEDDEEPQSPLGGEGMLGLGDNETIQGLERGIRDMAGRVLGSQEVQNLSDQVRAGALKVS